MKYQNFNDDNAANRKVYLTGFAANRKFYLRVYAANRKFYKTRSAFKRKFTQVSDLEFKPFEHTL